MRTCGCQPQTWCLEGIRRQKLLWNVRMLMETLLTELRVLTPWTQDEDSTSFLNFGAWTRTADICDFTMADSKSWNAEDSGYAAMKDSSIELWAIRRILEDKKTCQWKCRYTDKQSLFGHEEKLLCTLMPTLEARYLYWRTGICWMEPLSNFCSILVFMSREFVCHEEWVILGKGLVYMLMPLMLSFPP